MLFRSFPAGLSLGGYGTYKVNKSLRFRDAATAYLSKTFSTPTNNKIWTYSCWFKRSKGIQDYNVLFGALFNALLSALFNIKKQKEILMKVFLQISTLAKLLIIYSMTTNIVVFFYLLFL